MYIIIPSTITNENFGLNISYGLFFCMKSVIKQMDDLIT